MEEAATAIQLMLLQSKAWQCLVAFFVHKQLIEVNIQIMRAFVSMRHFMVNNASVFSRLEMMEYHQLEILQHQQDTDNHIEATNKRIDEVFRRLDEGNAKPKQGVFYVVRVS